MKFDKNGDEKADDGSFVNEAILLEETAVAVARRRESLEPMAADKTKQNKSLLLSGFGNPETNAGEELDCSRQEESAESDQWLRLSRQVRGAIAVKNIATSKPNRVGRRLGRRSTTANIDPFLQKFSTREIRLAAGSATNSPIDGDISFIDESKNLTAKSDGATDLPKDENIEYSMDVLTYTRVLIAGCCSPTGVIDPDGSFLYYWFYFVITAVRYNYWAIILRVAFEESQNNYSALWWILDSFADLVFLMDIFINCRVGFVEEGILVKNGKLACKRYINSFQFYLDVISVIPLEFFYALIGVRPALRFPRLLKVYKSQEVKKCLEGRANHPTGVRVFFLVHLMLVMVHWNAGIYFLISRHEGFGTNEWVYPTLNGSYDTLTQKYVRSFYWSLLTLTTIGDLPAPVTNLEYFYTIACYLAGVFVFAMIVGNAGSIILNMNASRLEFERQRDNAKSYMEIHNVPRDLQRRVLKWYDYSWSRGRLSGEGGDLNSLHLLPDKMKTEIALHVHVDTLKRVTFLQNCEPEFLHELLLKMKLHIFTPGDLIIRHGEIAREMYLIAHGKIEVISETGKVLKQLGAGDFFGEIGILSLSEGQNRRTADIRSIGYTECFVLSKDDVLGEIQQFPRAKRILAEYGQKRLQNTGEDPRLVKLDDPAPTEPEKQTTAHTENSHVVDIQTAAKASHDGEVKQDSSGSKRWSKDRVKAINSLVKSRKESGGAIFAEKELVLEKDGNQQESGCRNNAECSSVLEVDTCLDMMDNLKVVLQNAITNDINQQKDYMLRLKSQLTIEKEKLLKAEYEIISQKRTISELERANRALKNEIKERDNSIHRMQHEFQAPRSTEPGHTATTERLEEATELISLQEEKGRFSPQLQDTDNDVVGDSPC